MGRCCVPGCSTGKVRKEAGFVIEVEGKGHRSMVFPKDENRRHLWFRQIKRLDLLESAKDPVICDLHFGPEMYVEDNKDSRGRIFKKPKLKSTAFPTLHLGHKDLRIKSNPDGTMGEVGYEDAVVTPYVDDHGYGSLMTTQEKMFEKLPEAVKKRKREEQEVDDFVEDVINTVRENEDEIARIKANIKHLEQEIEAVSKIFSKDQLTNLYYSKSSRHQPKWDEETIMKAIELYCVAGKKMYCHLLYMGFPFPSLQFIKSVMVEAKLTVADVCPKPKRPEANA